MSHAPVKIVHYTDPGCPFAFSAERQLRQLEWHYGDQVDVETRMIVLADSAADYEAKGFNPEKLQGGLTHLQGLYGMPISLELRERVSGTREACAAYVAARRHAPADAAARLLRELRVLGMAGHLLDAQDTIDRAAAAAGIDAAELSSWVAEPETTTELEADKHAARHPHESAVALAHKLAKWDDGWRYTAPSLEVSAGRGDGDVITVPGFQPIESIDVAIAHVAPWVERAASAETVEEVLSWADFPLATAEVAAIRGISIDKAHAELNKAGASYHEVGADGYWQLAKVGATA